MKGAGIVLELLHSASLSFTLFSLRSLQSSLHAPISHPPPPPPLRISDGPPPISGIRDPPLRSAVEILTSQEGI